MEEKNPIYEPAEDSELLANVVVDKASGRVLDMGTGSGIQAFTAAKSLIVKQVTAVDINPLAVEHVKSLVLEKKLKRFNIIQSDLFSNVDGLFETIIFNPPYLPQDYFEDGRVAVSDPALYGGKKGYETIVRFLNTAPAYLSREGKILLLFSSLSGKTQVEEAIEKNMLQFVQLVESKQPMMETLYVYEITSTAVRESLVALGVKDLKYHAKGSRGVVYKGKYDVNSNQKKFLASNNYCDVAIKIKLDSSSAPGTLALEARNLRLVNKKGIGPKLYYEHSDFLVMSFVEGVGLDKFVETHENDSVVVKKSVVALLHQAYQLDLMKLNKDEMHRPYSNVLVSLVNGNVNLTLLDFERCRNSDNLSNVTGVVSFLMKLGLVEKEQGIKLAEGYKKNYSKIIFEQIIGLL